MQRVQWIELEDLPWVPAAIRDGGTDLLDLGFERVGFYDGVAPELAAVIAETGARTVRDLCSGGGGGTLAIRRALGAAVRDVDFELSDLHPSANGRARVVGLADPRVRYRDAPVDAMSGLEGDGIRTMSGALHHFPPDAVGALVAAIVARRAPLAFFDVAAAPAMRRMPWLLAPIAITLNTLALAVGSLFLMPLVRPVRASNLALTYLLPLIPLLVGWDGTVSALRAYAPDELLAIARAVPGGDRYVWNAGVRGRALFLTGVPRD